MGRRIGIVIGTLFALLIAGGALAAVRVPPSCYTAPDGAVSWSDRFRHLVRLDFAECDPFAGPPSKRPITELTIALGWSGASPGGITLTIKPDGTARIARGVVSDEHMPVALTPADYAFFRTQLAPLRDYVGTEIRDRPETRHFEDPSRKRILCESTDIAGETLTIAWITGAQMRARETDPRYAQGISSFETTCRGPAGAALRARLRPVLERLGRLDTRWTPDTRRP